MPFRTAFTGGFLMSATPLLSELTISFSIAIWRFMNSNNSLLSLTFFALLNRIMLGLLNKAFGNAFPKVSATVQAVLVRRVLCQQRRFGYAHFEPVFHNFQNQLGSFSAPSKRTESRTRLSFQEEVFCGSFLEKPFNVH